MDDYLTIFNKANVCKEEIDKACQKLFKQYPISLLPITWYTSIRQIYDTFEIMFRITMFVNKDHTETRNICYNLSSIEIALLTDREGAIEEMVNLSFMNMLRTSLEHMEIDETLSNQS